MTHPRKSRKQAKTASDPSRAQEVDAGAARLAQCRVSEAIRLSPTDFLSFWNDLHEKPRLTSAQLKLGSIMRGDE